MTIIVKPPRYDYHGLSISRYVIISMYCPSLSNITSEVMKVGQKVYQSLKEFTNVNQAELFAKSIVHQLESYIQEEACSSMKGVDVEQLSSGSVFLCVHFLAWKSFLCPNLGTLGHPIFWKCVGDHLFKSLIKKSFPVIRQEAEVDDTLTPTISYQEMNALRYGYATGYVPRALCKKLEKSANPLKGQLLLCLVDALDQMEGKDYIIYALTLKTRHR